MRLNKFLAKAGIASRRKSDELIQMATTMVNGKVCLDPAYHVKKEDSVHFDGKKVIVEKKKIVLEQIGDIEFQQPERINLKVLMPYIKKENLFFAIQKVTEIGVSNISLFRPDNVDQSISKKDLSKINEKSLSIITQACEQNGSNIVPDFQIYEDLSSAIDHDSFSIFFDLDATNDFQSIKNFEDSITLITGPESGFSKKEREFLNATTSHNISLGKNILRAETAAISVISALRYAAKEF